MTRKADLITVSFDNDAVTFDIYERRVFGEPDSHRILTLNYSNAAMLPVKRYADLTSSRDIFFLPREGQVVGFEWETHYEGAQQGIDSTAQGPFLIRDFPIDLVIGELRQTLADLLNRISELESHIRASENAEQTGIGIGHNHPPSEFEELREGATEAARILSAGDMKRDGSLMQFFLKFSGQTRTFNENIMHGIADSIGKAMARHYFSSSRRCWG